MAKRIADAAVLTKLFRTTTLFNHVLNKVNVLSIGDGKCLAELKIDESHVNPMGTLHGGLLITLVDVISGYALLSKIGPDIPHVSTEIHTSFLKAAMINDSIIIEGSVDKIGEKLAFLKADIKNKANGDLLAKGSHITFILK